MIKTLRLGATPLSWVEMRIRRLRQLGTSLDDVQVELQEDCALNWVVPVGCDLLEA